MDMAAMYNLEGENVELALCSMQPEVIKLLQMSEDQIISERPSCISFEK